MADTLRRLELLYDLPLQFAAETRLEIMLEITVERLTKIVPGAANGALLLSSTGLQNLLLKACQSWWRTNCKRNPGPPRYRRA